MKTLTCAQKTANRHNENLRLILEAAGERAEMYTEAGLGEESDLKELGNDIERAIEESASLFNAAPALFAAGQKVLKSWERGDLAGAVRELTAAINTVKGNI